jgi:hypothetical protein
MQKILLFMICGFVLASCGPKKAPGNDPRFDVFKAQFQAEAAKRDLEVTDGELSIPISFGETGSDSDGICVVPGMGKNAFSAAANTLFNSENFDRKFIQLHPSILEKDLFYIEAVVFHELAHCLLGRDHTDSKSLMNESQENNVDYPLKRSLYLDELFGIEANFLEFGRLGFCSAIDEEEQPLDEAGYQAFGRELSYSLFYSKKEDQKSFCVVAKLKR